jgi:hypothetical protein
MKLLSSVFWVFIIFLVFGCKKEESLIEGESPPQYFYIVTGDQPNTIKLFELNSKKVEVEDVFYLKNKIKLDQISQIVEYRGILYIFQKETYRITIAYADSLIFIKNLDWSNEKRKPSSIAFANATTGFISFENDSIVSVLDLTNFQVAREVTTKSPISYLENVEQYIIGLSISTGLATIIDSRTFSVERAFWVGDSPLSCAYSSNRNTVFILCAGKGKYDSSQVKTKAKIITLSFPDFNKALEVDLNIGSTSANDLVPTGLTVYGKYFGFISTFSGLLRFSLSNPSQIQRYVAGEFYNLVLDSKKETLIALARSDGQTNFFLINPVNSAIISKHLINSNILLVFPF